MFSEDRFPTMRLMKCRKCGTVFPAKLDGQIECPDCESKNAKVFDPIQDRTSAGESAS